MAQKKSKFKISSIKRGNQLRTKLLKQGKLRIRRNRAKIKKICRPSIPKDNKRKDEENNSKQKENILNRIDEHDMSFLRNSVSDKSYSFLKNLQQNNEEILKKRPRSHKRKADIDDSKIIEGAYEQLNHYEAEIKRKKFLLPIKTSEGIVLRSEQVNNDVGDMETEDAIYDSEFKNSESPNEDDKFKETSTAELLACRQKSLLKHKFRIGSLCSGLTENPELKIKNFKPLLEMLIKNDPEVCITAKKLALMSLLEVFKDLLPGYQIKHHSDPKVKLKKATKQLYSYENDLLKYYKEYLKKLERTVLILKRKKGDNRVFKKPELKFAEMSLQCLTDLLKTHPHFNFSKNVVHLLVPFLNNSMENVRAIVSSGIREVFKADKKGEISLEIVRNINKLVKSKTNIVHSEVLNVCLNLKIKDVNLEKEKEEELKKKKEMVKKHKFMKMSKRERKRSKKFQELEKELLETKAEENKKSKTYFSTEITKALFTIYFRILKMTPSSKLLNAALEGLAKFAHCINFEFYQDLIYALNNLIQREDLGYKEKLSCVQTVFTVLYYKGTTINIDPIKFYSHFYANILKINAGKNHSDLPAILKTIDFVLLKRSRHLSLQRLLAFTKRLIALALQVLPNGSLALLSSVKQILQLNNSTDLLLDLESGQAQGVYCPEMDEPEYCNAGATSLWEFLLLQKHFHPTVKDYAFCIAKLEHKNQDATQFKSFLKLSPEKLFEEFDSTNVKFKPAVPPPKKFSQNKRKPGLLQQDLEDHVKKFVEMEKTSYRNIFKKS